MSLNTIKVKIGDGKETIPLSNFVTSSQTSDLEEILDCLLKYELIFNLEKYYKKKTNVSDIVIKFNMKNPKKKYHIPVIIAPNGYSVWWSK